MADKINGKTPVCQRDINMKSKQIIYNEINKYVVELLNYFSKQDPVETYKNIQKYIKKSMKQC